MKKRRPFTMGLDFHLRDAGPTAEKRDIDPAKLTSFVWHIAPVCQNLLDSVKEFGFVDPVILIGDADTDLCLIDGNHRLVIALRLGISIPVVAKRETFDLLFNAVS